MWDLIVSVPDLCLYFYFESLLRHVYHLTERDTRMLTCIASDIRDGIRNRGQDNVTNIKTGSGVRRIIF